jgi:hypothetical protein
MKEYNYYLMKPGSDYEKLTQGFIEEQAAKWDARKAVLEKYGTTKAVYNNARLIGLVFENKEKVPAGFSRSTKDGQDVYVPNKRTKEGKAVAKEFDLPILSSLEYHLMVCAKDDNASFGITQGANKGGGIRVMFCTFQKITQGDSKGSFVLCVPTDGEGNKAWTPDLAQVRELKPSEFFKMMGQ